MPDSPIRIAMWSGPRNISTAMMRSFGSRPDTAVCDEPFYAHYLKSRPEVDHPGREEVIARHETDPAKVIAFLLGPVPGGHKVFYQKHMTHHLLPGGVDRAWMRHPEVRHAFLIRDPAEVIASFSRIAGDPTPEDLGLPQQVEIFREMADASGTGRIPPVIDARDVLLNPPRMLALLCDALGVGFDERMLSWEPGPRETDGVWAKHWYATVEKSSGFEEYRPRESDIPDRLRPVLDRCMDCYRELAAVRLR